MATRQAYLTPDLTRLVPRELIEREKKKILLRRKVCAYLTCRLMGDPTLCIEPRVCVYKRERPSPGMKG